MNLQEVEVQRTRIADGFDIHYAEAGHGPALVFVHGGFGDWLSWAPQWAAFVPHFHCFTYSRRYSTPNGNRSTDTDHSVIAEARDLEALLDFWKVESPVLVGTSYGAYIILQLALTSCRKIGALALTEPPILPFADLTPGGREARLAFEQDILRPAGEAFANGETERAVYLLTEGINGSAPGEATSAEGLARRLRNAEAMRALSVSSQAYPALNIEKLRAFDVPTLLLKGRNTEPIHSAIFSSLCALMPQAEHIHVPDSGHGVHRDNPDAFNEIVLRFVRRHAS
jgi:pimeloyl-ACP methyl ester carboxylesterase